MEPNDRTYYARLEALERGMERVQSILAEHSRRIDVERASVVGDKLYVRTGKEGA